jgi:FixJ family two-component response regulator
VSSVAPVIHVVDDDAAFRTALARLLEAASYQVALYESASKLLETPWRNGPGCILLDLQMPGLDGLELQHRLAELGQSLPIVFLTGHGDVAASVRAIKAGAEDFLLKPVPKDRLLEVVERALLRYEKGREQNAVLRSLRALVATLTPRELEVFKLVVRGKLNKQVAYELGTSERTIKAHRRSIMEKLRVRSVAEAASIAERLGILTAPARSADPFRR